MQIIFPEVEGETLLVIDTVIPVRKAQLIFAKHPMYFAKITTLFDQFARIEIELSASARSSLSHVLYKIWVAENGV